MKFPIQFAGQICPRGQLYLYATAVHADKFDLQTESETSCFMITLMLRGTGTTILVVVQVHLYQYKKNFSVSWWLQVYSSTSTSTSTIVLYYWLFYMYYSTSTSTRVPILSRRALLHLEPMSNQSSSRFCPLVQLSCMATLKLGAIIPKMSLVYKNRPQNVTNSRRSCSGRLIVCVCVKVSGYLWLSVSTRPLVVRLR